MVFFDFAYQYQSKRKHIAISRAGDYLGIERHTKIIRNKYD